LGPPAGLLLKSGRVLIPAYHSTHSWDNGEFSHGHTMLSDDSGETWKLGGIDFGKESGLYSNEDQAV